MHFSIMRTEMMGKNSVFYAGLATGSLTCSSEFMGNTVRMVLILSLFFVFFQGIGERAGDEET